MAILFVLIMGACASPEVYNAGDPASDEFFQSIALRCALGDVVICPLVGSGSGAGAGSASGPGGGGGASSGISQITPSVGTTALKLWLEADQFSQANGTPVTNWPDSSASGFNATQGTGGQQPTYQVSSIGGLPAVRFDDTATPGNNLILGANYLYSSNDGITILAVASSNAQDTVSDYILDFGSSGTDGYGLTYSANADGVGNNARLHVATGHGGDTVAASEQVAPGSGAIVVARVKFSPAGDKHISIYVNGNLRVENTTHTLTALTATEINEAATRGSATDGPVTIGGQSKTFSETNRFLDGDLSLVLWFDRALTDAERQGYECYAALKYSITVPQNCI